MRKTTTTAAIPKNEKEDNIRKRQISQSLDASASLPTAADVEYEMLREAHLITTKKAYPPKEYVFRIHGIPTVSIGDLCLIQGQAKQGKSSVIKVFVKACHCGKMGNVEKALDKEDVKIIIFDTEMFECDTANNYHYMLSDSNIDENFDKLQVMNLRTMSPGGRCDFIRDVSHREKPDVIIIDGIRDLVNDINDPVGCPKLVQELMDLASELRCAIICVLHNNYGEGKARGWLGSEIINKCGSAFEVMKEYSVVTIKNTIYRGAPVPEWKYTFGSFGQPICDEQFVKHAEEVAAEKKAQEEMAEKAANNEAFLEKIMQIIQEKGPMKRSELVKELEERDIAKKTKAQDFIKAQLDNPDSPLKQLDGMMVIKPKVTQGELFN